MICARIRALFDAYWDDETTQAERERIEAHFAECPRCREAYEAHARTLEAVASLPRLEAAPDLVERVMAGARRAAPVPDRLPAAMPAWVPAAAVATLALAAVTALTPWLATRPERLARTTEPEPIAVREPVLVRATPVGTAVAPSPTAAAPTASALTDSLFDHSEDIEFIVDPVAMRRGRGEARSPLGVQSDDVTISF
jgi:predicted anti-sigma-YlaC factor YlaD